MKLPTGVRLAAVMTMSVMETPIQLLGLAAI
jgi:hypothetical protein